MAPTVTFVPTDDAADDEAGNVVIITLEDIEITHFYSRDPGIHLSTEFFEDIFHMQPTCAVYSRREGVVTFLIGDQPTSVGFVVEPDEGDTMGDVCEEHKKRLRNRVLYMGKVKRSLPFSVEVIESDDEERRMLDKAAGFLGGVSSIAKAVPIIGATAAPVVNLTASLMNAAKSLVGDDVELLLETSLFDGQCPSDDNPLSIKSGRYVIYRKGKVLRDEKRKRGGGKRTKQTGISITLRAHRFETSLCECYDALVVLGEVDLRGYVEEDTIEIHTSFGTSADQVTFERDVVGRTGKASRGNITKLRDRTVYDGPVDWILPFEAKLVARPEKSVDILSVAEPAITFAQGYTDEGTDQKLEKLTKAMPSVRDVLGEFVAKKNKSLLTVGGAFCLPSAVSNKLSENTGMTVHFLEEKLDVWQKFTIMGIEADGKSRPTLTFSVKLFHRRKQQPHPASSDAHGTH